MSESGPSWREDLKKKSVGRQTDIILEWIKEIFQIIFHLLVGNYFNIILHPKKYRKPQQKQLIVGLSGSYAAVSDGWKTIFYVGF